VSAVSAVLAAGGDEFVAPGPAEFEFPPVFAFVTKPMLIIVLGVIVIGAFFYAAAHRPALVPGKLQFLAEEVYGFVRNGIARDTIGAKEGMKYVPYLVTLFVFIAFANITGIIPPILFPANSHIAFPLVLALITWGIFNYVGIRKQGFIGYFKNMMFPPGIPWPVYLLLAPIEFLSTVVIRPITLTLRLTLNMFAGHLVLMLCMFGGAYLLSQGGVLAVLSIIPFLFAIVLTFFEGFVQLLQAYVFTLLSALYVAGAESEEH
jgi:F-type H+-transporting ATPase subunit a